MEFSIGNKDNNSFGFSICDFGRQYMKPALARALGSETRTCAPFLVFRISSDSEAGQSGAHQRRRPLRFRGRFSFQNQLLENSV